MVREKDLASQLLRKGFDADAIAAEIIRSPEMVGQAVALIDDPRTRVKFGAMKVLRIASAQRPQIVYPHIERLIELLDSGNNIFKWGATIIIANLAGVDDEDRIDSIFEKYFAPIDQHVMIARPTRYAGAAKSRWQGRNWRIASQGGF